jgi:hypothetical protein
MIERPAPQVPRVEIEARVAIEERVNGVPDSMFPNLSIYSLAAEENSAPLVLGCPVASLEDDGLNPGQLRLKVILRRKHSFARGLGRVGVVVQDEGAGVQVNDEAGATFGEAVEEAEGGFVSPIEQLGASGKGGGE